VRDRFNIMTPMSSVQPLVISYEDGEWVLWSARQGKAYIFNAFLTEGSEPTALGARLSPLNNRFPITNRAEAMQEAKLLTEERVKL
jgi:hypothetical protein